LRKLISLLHSDYTAHIERLGELKIPAILNYIMGLLDFHGTYEILFIVDLKHSSF
jgi:hypothetical protein